MARLEYGLRVADGSDHLQFERRRGSSLLLQPLLSTSTTSTNLRDPAQFPQPGTKVGFGFIDSRIPNGPLFFYVSEYEIESLPNNGVLDSPANLWVTLNNSTGATNVASSTVPTDPNANLGARIEYARGIAKGFQSAAQ